MASIQPQQERGFEIYEEDTADPPSGIRLTGNVSGELFEPEPCSSCGVAWGTRRLPKTGGPVYCHDCVPDAPLDQFDAIYVDLGGRG